jgi:hypothetical protein
MTSLQELRERIGRLTGPDREVDAALWALTNCVDDTTYLYGAGGYPDGTRIKSYRRPGPRWFAPRYTASLEAALGLVERVSPAQDIAICRVGGQWEADMGPPESFQRDGHALGPTAPLALLLALLAALSSAPTPGGEDNG